MNTNEMIVNDNSCENNDNDATEYDDDSSNDSSGDDTLLSHYQKPQNCAVPLACSTIHDFCRYHDGSCNIFGMWI